MATRKYKNKPSAKFPWTVCGFEWYPEAFFATEEAAQADANTLLGDDYCEGEIFVVRVHSIAQIAKQPEPARTVVYTDIA